mgnify:CR=1 FL=1
MCNNLGLWRQEVQLHMVFSFYNCWSSRSWKNCKDEFLYCCCFLDIGNQLWSLRVGNMHVDFFDCCHMLNQDVCAHRSSLCLNLWCHNCLSFCTFQSCHPTTGFLYDQCGPQWHSPFYQGLVNNFSWLSEIWKALPCSRLQLLGESVDGRVLSKWISTALVLIIVEWLLTHRLSSFSFAFKTWIGVPVFWK